MATFTYESIKNKLKDPAVDGNLHLDDDGAILKIGADSDIQSRQAAIIFGSANQDCTVQFPALEKTYILRNSYCF